MLTPRALLLSLGLLLVGLVGPSFSEDAEAERPTIEHKTEAMQKIDGFVPLFWDAKEGRLWLEIGRFGEELLYMTSLPAGVGSNDIGLDRGQLSGARIVRFERVGPKLLMLQPNYDYRAVTENPEERRAVEEAFARSVLWGFTVGAESGDRVLVELSPYDLSRGRIVYRYK